jgi:hypothetical protein
MKCISLKCFNFKIYFENQKESKDISLLIFILNMDYFYSNEINFVYNPTDIIRSN